MSAVEQQIELEARNRSPAEIFITVFRRYAEMIDENRQYTRLAYQETKTLTPSQRRPLFERDQRILELLKRAAAPALRSGDFDEDALDLEADLLDASLSGVGHPAMDPRGIFDS